MLDIKAVRQEEGSVECGLVTLSMLYSHYGENKTLEELRKEITTVDVGTFSPQLGIHLIQNGFSVEIITRNPLLVERKNESLSQEELLRKFEEKLRTYESNDDNYTGLNYFINFMKAGGKVKIKIPDIKDLKEELDNKRPVISYLSNASLYPENIAKKINKPFSYTFHAVLVVGTDDKNVTVNDPYWGNEGGSQTYSPEEFFYAMHASALGGVDNDCLIKAKKVI